MHSIEQLEQLMLDIRKKYLDHWMFVTKRTLSFWCWVNYEKLLHIKRYPKYVDEAYKRMSLLLTNEDEII